MPVTSTAVFTVFSRRGSLKAINQKANKVMDVITAGLVNIGDHKIIDNTEGAFMPVHVELINKVGTTADGRDTSAIFSVAHYFKQHGDMMADPEMLFWRAPDGNYYPTYFKQDGGLPIEQESAILSDDEPIRFYPRLQKDHAIFAGTWMRNIK
ncbi:DUF6908 domain-containing protein [Thermodesulfobacteriota bacterium]